MCSKSHCTHCLECISVQTAIHTAKHANHAHWKQSKRWMWSDESLNTPASKFVSTQDYCTTQTSIQDGRQNWVLCVQELLLSRSRHQQFVWWRIFRLGTHKWILSQKIGDAADIVTQLSARSSPSTSRLLQPKQRNWIELRRQFIFTAEERFSSNLAGWGWKMAEE